jgi:hypothetical protein
VGPVGANPDRLFAKPASCAEGLRGATQRLGKRDRLAMSLSRVIKAACTLACTRADELFDIATCDDFELPSVIKRCRVSDCSREAALTAVKIEDPFFEDPVHDSAVGQLIEPRKISKGELQQDLFTSARPVRTSRGQVPREPTPQVTVRRDPQGRSRAAHMAQRSADAFE